MAKAIVALPEAHPARQLWTQVRNSLKRMGTSQGTLKQEQETQPEEGFRMFQELCMGCLEF